MPSKLQQVLALNTKGTYAQVKEARREGAQKAEATRVTVRGRGPFDGYQPDIDPNLATLTSFQRVRNVLAHAEPATGEVLGLPDGFDRVDSDSLGVLGAANQGLGDAGTIPATPATDAKPIIRLDHLYRTDTTGALTGEFQPTLMAVTADTGAGDGYIYRLSPVSNNWTHVPSSGVANLSGGRDGRTGALSMPDSVTAPFGAPNRASHSGVINMPCWIYTNDVDEVMVFPRDNVNHEYEPLTAVGTLDPFLAKSVAMYNGRIYFLNTSEAGTRFQRRLRRTAKGTANPDPGLIGAGRFDFSQFTGQGLRVLPLGDVLACYFQDGVAFVRATGNPTNPDDEQVLDANRGLMGTHAVCSIGRSGHFGIFTDGWWVLDQSGRWEERGVVNMDGKIVPKWRETFYRSLDSDNRHRLYTYYDQYTNRVYILFPRTGDTDVQEVWIYELESDRVFIENYQATCMAGTDLVVSAGTVWDAATGTWDTFPGVWDAYGPVFGLRTRVHGNLSGLVFKHRPTLSTYDGQAIAWAFGAGVRSPNGTPNLYTVDRVSLEAVDLVNSGQVTISAVGALGTGDRQDSTGSLTQGTPDAIINLDGWFRYTSRAVSYDVSGQGPFHIRAVEAELMTDTGGERG